jgi:hypothetical protein
MEKNPEKKKAESMPSPADDLTKAISELEQLINDLRDFDVKTIASRLTINTIALEDRVNDTLSDIFGKNSAEYRKHSILTFDTLPTALGRPQNPLPEVQQAYQKGINDCVIKLKSLKETLEQELPDTE